MKLMIFLCCLLFAGISVYAQGTVTVTATDLSPTFTPGTSTPIVSLSFIIVGSPIINQIIVDRTGTASNTDVTTAKLYRDVNQNNVVDGGDIQLDQTRFFQGSTTQSVQFQALNYSPSTSENLLIVYDIATGAVASNTAGASMPAGYITGGNLTTVVFAGLTTSDRPLPVEITTFIALVQNKSVNLKWQTATEVNNYGFEILRFAQNDNSDWIKVGFVQGHGNSNSQKEYSFEDKNPQVGKMQYRLRQIDFDGNYKFSDIIKLQIDTPSEIVLHQNYPNPFNPTTTIKYEIPKGSFVRLSIFDLLGRKIVSLVNQVQNAGYHEISFNGKDLSSGIYVYQIQTDEFSQIKKMLLIK